MLEEAAGVIRELHTGREVSHHDRYPTVEDARLYTVPDQPVPATDAGTTQPAAFARGRATAGIVGYLGPATDAATTNQQLSPAAGLHHKTATRVTRGKASTVRYLSVRRLPGW